MPGRTEASGGVGAGPLPQGASPPSSSGGVGKKKTSPFETSTISAVNASGNDAATGAEAASTSGTPRGDLAHASSENLPSTPGNSLVGTPQQVCGIKCEIRCFFFMG